MKKNKTFLMLSLVLLAVSLGLGFWFVMSRSSSPVPVPNPAPKNPTPTRYGSLENIEVPDKDSVVPQNVAKPSIVAPAAPNSESQYRGFYITIKNGEFMPNTVIIREQDTARISITAVDRSYDFYQPDYGLRQTFRRGEQKIVEFQAAASGKFTFFCESCGGPEKGPVGYLIVIPK